MAWTNRALRSNPWWCKNSIVWSQGRSERSENTPSIQYWGTISGMEEVSNTTLGWCPIVMALFSGSSTPMSSHHDMFWCSSSAGQGLVPEGSSVA